MKEAFFKRLEGLGRLEAVVKYDEDDFLTLHIRPAECAPIFWEPFFDVLSLLIQEKARKVGVVIPDWRFRIITNPATDGIEGVHFGILDGAIEKTWRIKERLLQQFG